MPRNQFGFTLIEITVVLVLMAIIAAYVIGRSIGTEQIDLAAQTDKIRNQIRYVQSTSMKQSDENTIWGIISNSNQYWMLKRVIGTPIIDTLVIMPGEQNAQITLSDMGIDSLTNFILFFDRIGKPYTQYDTTQKTSLDDPLTIVVSAGTQSRDIRVIPETGLVQ